MTRPPTARPRAGAATLVLLLCCGLLTFGQTFAAEVLDGCIATITQAGSTQALHTGDCRLQVRDIHPSSTGTFPVTIRNRSGAAITAALTVTDVETYEGGCNRPELTTGDVTCDDAEGHGELDRWLRLAFGPVPGGGTAHLWEGTLAELEGSDPTSGRFTVPPGQTWTVPVDWELPFAADNTVQTDRVTWTWRLDTSAVNAPPVCTAAAPQPAVLWPPDHRYVPIAITGVTDLTGDTTVRVTDVRQDEAVDAKGSGSTTPDATISADGLAAVRAERVGGRDGRVYAISFTATDEDGLTCDGQLHVTVPHDQSGPPAVDSGTTSRSTG